ncbi:hypothetical protein K1719_033157 [Acacia pycnantha]|nr:hypothetical protein K1719_033157 [Acacia pycnantha]
MILSGFTSWKAEEDGDECVVSSENSQNCCMEEDDSVMLPEEMGPNKFCRWRSVASWEMANGWSGEEEYGRAKAAVNDDYVAEASKLSFYELLGIPESGSLLEIKQAYKQLARKYYPDVLPPNRVGEYTKRFIQVQEAFETLSDPRRRAMYDGNMAKGIHLAFSARRCCYDDEVLIAILREDMSCDSVRAPRPLCLVIC